MKKLFTDFPETHVAVYAAIIHRYNYLFYFSSNFDQTIKAFLLTLREALNTPDTLANFICLEYQNEQPTTYREPVQKFYSIDVIS